MLKSRLKNYFCVIILNVLFCNCVFAENKIALVVGNDAYQNVAKLRKAVNDSNAISRILNESGFYVIQGNNVDENNFSYKLNEFISRLNKDDVAMFYYAGHGIEINGHNYLLPTDIPDAIQGQEYVVKIKSLLICRISWLKLNKNK